jgi:hypothetical protein
MNPHAIFLPILAVGQIVSDLLQGNDLSGVITGAGMNRGPRRMLPWWFRGGVGRAQAVGGDAGAQRPGGGLPGTAESSGRDTGTARAVSPGNLLDGSEPHLRAPDITTEEQPSETTLAEQSPAAREAQYKGLENKIASNYHVPFGRRLLAGLISAAANFDRRNERGESVADQSIAPRIEYAPLRKGLQPLEAAIGETQNEQETQQAGEREQEQQSRLAREQAGTRTETLTGDYRQAQLDALKQKPTDKLVRTEGGQAVYQRPDGSTYAKGIEGFAAPAKQAKVLDRYTNAAGQRVVVFDDGTQKIEGAAHVRPEGAGTAKGLSANKRADIEQKKNDRLAQLERQFSMGQIDAQRLAQQKQTVQDEYLGELKAGGANVAAQPGRGTATRKVGDVVGYKGSRYRIVGIDAKGNYQLQPAGR